MKTFSERLIALRKERGITQTDLANLLKKKRTTISGYEIEGKEPDYESLCGIADYFGVTVDFLLGRNQNRSSASSMLQKENYENLAPECKTAVDRALGDFYSLLNREMESGLSESLFLYQDLMSELLKSRYAVKKIIAGSNGDVASIFPQLMEKQNSLKGEISSVLDSLLQADVVAAKKGRGEKDE